MADEQIEIPLLIDKAKEKYEALDLKPNASIVSQKDSEDAFKIFMQLKKLEDRRNEVNSELAEVENVLKEFIGFLKDNKILFEKKDDNKNKLTFLFWVEDGQLKCNR